MKKLFSWFKRKYTLRSSLSSLAAALVLTTLAGIAFASPGFDVQQVKVNSGSVWILQTGLGQRYGLVNTELQELSSANTIYQPSEITQSGTGALIFASANARFGVLEASEPVEYIDDPSLFKKPPVQVKDVQTDAGVVAYLANGGELWLSSITGTEVTDPIAILPPENTSNELKFDAISLGQDGVVHVFSKSDSTVRAFDVYRSQWTSLSDVVSDAGQGSFQLSSVANRWVLLDDDSGRAWIRDVADQIAPALTGDTLLQRPAPSGSEVFIAHENGLVSLNVETGAIENVLQADGIPAQPVWFADSVYAAWLGESNSGGSLYSSASGVETELSYNGLSLEDTPVPVIQANEYTAVVNETSSGWAWRARDGRLIPSTQNWNLLDQDSQESSDTAEETEVTVPKPPVAENDSFGVRSGQLSNLQVLLNDHDPNKDIISIDPSSIEGLDPSFGTVGLADDGQSLVLRTADGASGSATISYRLSDGTSSQGLYSAPATVQVSIVSASADSAPLWCEEIVTECLRQWPRPQVEPGGSVFVSVLEGWVDPESDSLFVASVELADGSGSAGIDDSGRVVYKHGDDGQPQASNAQITVTVSDIRGNQSTKQLGIVVSPDPLLEITPFTVATSVDQPTRIDLGVATSGSSGDLVINSAEVGDSQATAVTITLAGDDSMDFTASAPGEYIISLNASDDSGEIATFVRASVAERGISKVSIKPVTVLVAPGLDTIVDVFSSAYNPDSSVLLLDQVEESPLDGALLSAEIVGEGMLRVNGSTPNDTNGFIGVVNFLVTDGFEDSLKTVQGQAYVYQLGDSGSEPPVALDDEVTVRQGGFVDVDALANDVGSRGVPLVIDPTSFDQTCLPGGLVYETKGLLRVVAPEAPGEYVCPYVVANAGTPSLKAVGEVLIQVVSDGTNTPPNSPDLSMRVLAGEVGQVLVPLGGIDPDGDQVSLKSVSGSSAGLGFVSINEELTGIEYAALPGSRGQDSFTYTVEDSEGETATGLIRVGIIASDVAKAPVPMVDVLDITVGAGNRAALDPVANDFDPLGEDLNLEPGSVTPNTVAGTEAYKIMERAISSIEGNRVTFVASDTPMTMSYLYSVRNESGSISVGTILVRISQDVALVYPEVSDTRVSLRDRADLATGIDVLTNKVSWPTGDVSGLTLSLWDETQGFSVSDNEISGSAPDSGAVVIFQVSGLDFGGNEVISFGIMHIPSVENLPISLDIRAATQQVDENGSLTFDLASLVSLPAGVQIEVNGPGVAASGARENATCQPADGTSVTYNAGAGKPFTDSCIVPVRISGTVEYTSLFVPIEVIPENPQPELSQRQITVVPGRSYTRVLNLWDMTSWYDNDDFSSLDYQYQYSGSKFEISQDNNELDITAFGASRPGDTETATISISNYPETEPAALTLVVGQSPNDAPIGGNLSKECQASDTECVMSISDAVGEFNPYPDQPLVFAPFNYSTGTPNYEASSNVVKCGGVSIVATETRLEATWSATPPPESRTCDKITYLVLDAEGGVGRGSLSFVFNGLPGGPGGASQTGYGETTITIRIEAGPSGLSKPEVTSYKLREGSNEIDCPKATPTEAITTCKIEGQEAYNGRNPAARHTYVITAINEFGESSSSVTLSNAYAYKPPLDITTDVFRSVVSKVDDNPTDAFGVASVTISPTNDPAVRSYEITGLGSPNVVTRNLDTFSEFTVDVRARPGARSSITIKAIGAVPPPASGGPASSSTATWVGQLASAPTVSDVKAVLLGDNSEWGARVTAQSVNRNFSQVRSEVAFVVWRDGTAEPRCTWASGTNTLTVGDVSSPDSFKNQSSDTDYSTQVMNISSSDISGLSDGSRYLYKACYSNGYGMVQRYGIDLNALTALSDPEDGRFTFEVSASPVNGAWLVRLSSGTAPTGLRVQFNGSTTNPNDWRDTIFSTTYGSEPVIKVRYCLSSGTCSKGERLATASDTTKAWQMKVNRGFLTDENGLVAPCVLGANLYLGLEGLGLNSGSGNNWRGGSPGQGTSAQFFSGGEWQDMQDLGSNYRIPEDAAGVTLVRFYISGDSGIEPVRGLTGEAAVEFAVTCS
jgi:hypothetical protein